MSPETSLRQPIFLQMAPACGFRLVTQKDVLFEGFGCTLTGLSSPFLPSTESQTVSVWMVKNMVKSFLISSSNQPSSTFQSVFHPSLRNRLAKCSNHVGNKKKKTCNTFKFSVLSYTLFPLIWQHVWHKKRGQMKYVW